MLDDSFKLAAAGLLHYPTVLELMSYLQTERDYTPWRGVVTNLKHISSLFHNTTDEQIWRVCGTAHSHGNGGGGATGLLSPGILLGQAYGSASSSKSEITLRSVVKCIKSKHKHRRRVQTRGNGGRGKVVV